MSKRYLILAAVLACAFNNVFSMDDDKKTKWNDEQIQNIINLGGKKQLQEKSLNTSLEDQNLQLELMCHKNFITDLNECIKPKIIDSGSTLGEIQYSCSINTITQLLKHYNLHSSSEKKDIKDENDYENWNKEEFENMLQLEIPKEKIEKIDTCFDEIETIKGDKKTEKNSNTFQNNLRNMIDTLNTNFLLLINKTYNNATQEQQTIGKEKLKEMIDIINPQEKPEAIFKAMEIFLKNNIGSFLQNTNDKEKEEIKKSNFRQKIQKSFDDLQNLFDDNSENKSEICDAQKHINFLEEMKKMLQLTSSEEERLEKLKILNNKYFPVNNNVNDDKN